MAEILALVDTGCTVSMTLPATVVSSLGLASGPTGRAKLADGSVHTYDLYKAEVLWDGRWVPIVVSAVGREPLVGMRLMPDHQLRIEVVPGGAVEITPRP